MAELVREAAHQPHPGALVGDAGAQREAFAELRPVFNAPQPTVAGKIGSGGDIGLLGAERARRPLDRGDELAQGCSRPPRERPVRDRRGLRRQHDLGRISVRAQRCKHRSGITQTQARAAAAQILDDPGKPQVVEGANLERDGAEHAGGGALL